MARQLANCEESSKALSFGVSSNQDMNWNNRKRRQCQRYIFMFLVVGILVAAVSYHHYAFHGGLQNENGPISTTSSETNIRSHEGRLRRHLFAFFSQQETRSNLPPSSEPSVGSSLSLAPLDSPTADAQIPSDGFPTESPTPEPLCIGTRITVDEFYDIFFDDFDTSIVSFDLLEDAFRDSYNNNTNVFDCEPNILSISGVTENQEQYTEQISTKRIQFRVKSEQITSPGLFPDSAIRRLFIASLNKYLNSRQIPIYALAVKQQTEPDFTETPSFSPDFTEAPTFSPVDENEETLAPPTDESEETPAPPTDEISEETPEPLTDESEETLAPPTDPPTEKRKTKPPTDKPADSSPADQPTRDKTKPPTANAPTENIIDVNPTETPNTESATEKPSISEFAPDPTSRPTQTPSEDPNLSTEEPTLHPTTSPTSSTTSKPTVAPTSLGEPTFGPSYEPTLSPTAATDGPTSVPTESPATSRPTSSPTEELRNQPSKTVTPIEQPTEKPSEKPTDRPTPKPTEKPTPKPTEKPTLEPTLSETFEQTSSPNFSPSLSPNAEPILLPTKELLTESPTASPSESPTASPSESPTASPSESPTASPSESPTASPSLLSAMNPESTSRQRPTASPNTLSRAPAIPGPSLAPTILAAARPTRFPSSPPSKLTTSPTYTPTFDPTKRPSVRPTSPPTKSPSFSPTVSPSMHPSSFPTLEPTVSSHPSVYPSDVPSSSPSALPSAQPTAPPDYVLREPELTSVRMVLTGVSLLSTRSQLAWVDTTERAIRDEVITILNNQVELVNVRVSIISQNPQLSSSRKLQGEYQLLRNISATVASNLTMVFDVFFSIRAVIEEHNVRRYAGASLDTAEDQEIFILQLKSSGESAFQNLTSVRLILPSEPTADSAFQRDDDTETLSSGMTVGIAAVAIGGVAFIGAGYYVWTKRKPKQSHASSDQVVRNFREFDNNNMMVDVIERPELDVSTLGDPIPQGIAAPTDASLAEETNISLPYDYKVAAHILPSVDESASYSFSEVSSNASSNAMDVQTDDDTLDAQYFIEETIQVDAPPGMLGLVLEADKDGIATVCDMKQLSPVADRVHIGDKLVAVDDVDVSGMPVDEVTSLIASKQAKHVRTLAFSRRSKKLSAQDEAHL